MLSALLIVAGLLLLLYGAYLQINSQIDSQPVSNSAPVSAKGSQTTTPPQSFRGPVSIYYATQTGTAGTFAKLLASEAKSHGIIALIKNISACSVEELKEDRLSIFLISTHYEGEPTDDMRVFWQGFNKVSDPTVLRGLKYTGFALGDLNYKFYCQAGRLMNKKLETLGAERIYTFGEGSNDQGMIDEYFEEWTIPLWNALLLHTQPIPESEARTLLAQTDPMNFIVKLSDAQTEVDLTSTASMSRLDTATQVDQVSSAIHLHPCIPHHQHPRGQTGVHENREHTSCRYQNPARSAVRNRPEPQDLPGEQRRI